MRRIALVVLALLLAVASPARAEDAAAKIQAVQDYLNGITTLSARFVQTDNLGQLAAGVFYLSRPGRLRFQYDPPVTDFIVADGLFVYYYDSEMKQTSNTPISLSLADFFLRKNLLLSGDLSVTDVKKDGGLLQLTLVQTKEPGAGSLTLFFSEKPLQLKKWRIVDTQGAVTEVALSNLETGITLDPDLFKYQDPERKKTKYN
jgi:outer membrane lipoprotein-sorting protein